MVSWLPLCELQALASFNVASINYNDYLIVIHTIIHDFSTWYSPLWAMPKMACLVRLWVTFCVALNIEKPNPKSCCHRFIFQM